MSTVPETLYVNRRVRGDGFEASIRGHVLDLADPSSGHALAPTPNDLFVVSIASELAWFARRFLRACALPDDVGVSATWRPREGLPSVADIELRATLSGRADAVGAAIGAAFAKSLAPRTPTKPVVLINV